MRGLTTLAIQRVFSGIPNLQNRWNHVYGRLWTEEEKAAYLSSVADPDLTLRQCVGDFGLRARRTRAAPRAGWAEPPSARRLP